ncbi:MAG: hypothetical protein OXD29_14255 [Roseovarius sp.]|nr:hypothetical protein [Roseovarius sp.]
MLKRFGKWLSNVFAEHTVLQFLATAPAAYLAGLMLEFKQGAIIVLNALPPLFWPILAVFVLAVLAYPGFIFPFVKKVRDTR